jgi:glycosyltransferase involved in cell wall biosynthesis
MSVVIQDGMSDDCTHELVKEYESAFGAILQWRSEPDEGIADAWNKAIERVAGDWILFLGSDDRLANSNVISKACLVLETLPLGYNIAYGDVVMCHQDGRALEIIGDPWPRVQREFRLSHYCLQHQATFHRRTYFREYGRFNCALRICSDQDMLLRGLLSQDAFYIKDLTVSMMAIGGLSTRRKYAALANQELLRIQSQYRSVPLWDALRWKLVKAYIITLLCLIGGEGFALKGVNFYRVRLRRLLPLSY